MKFCTSLWMGVRGGLAKDQRLKSSYMSWIYLSCSIAACGFTSLVVWSIFNKEVFGIFSKRGMRRTHESTVLLFGKSFLLLLRWMHIVLFYLTAVIHSHNRANKKKNNNNLLQK